MLIPWSRLNAAIVCPDERKNWFPGPGIWSIPVPLDIRRIFSRGWVYYYGCLSGCRLLANFRFPLHDTCGVAGWIWKDNAPASQPVLPAFRCLPNRIWLTGKKRRSVVISSPDSSFTITSRLELYRFSIIDDLGPVLGSSSSSMWEIRSPGFQIAKLRQSSGQPPLRRP